MLSDEGLGLCLALHLQRASVILFSNSEVDVATELDAQRVEVGVGLLDGRPVHTVEERDLDGRQTVRVGQQIPGLARCAGEAGVGQVDRTDHFSAFL